MNTLAITRQLLPEALTARDGDVPLGIPPLRTWELNATTTRYDQLVAAPSDEELSIIWLTWTIVAWTVAAFVGSVLIAILVDKSTRNNAFNIYLCFLMFSDFVFSFCCGWTCLTCLLNHLLGHYWAPWMCRFQSFYCIWSIGSSIWMNAVIALQIHTMLGSGHMRQRYMVPRRITVIQHSLLLYLFNAVVAVIGILPPTWRIPHQSAAVSGEACLPVEFNIASTVVMFVGFFPLVAGIPVLYILYVCWNVYTNNLIPPSGRRRHLAIYFARITLSLIVMWVPFFFMVFAAARPWVNFAGGTWAHLQGAVSAGFGLMKPDTQKAYLNLWWWHCGRQSTDEDQQRKSMMEAWRSGQFLDSWLVNNKNTKQAGSSMSFAFFMSKWSDSSAGGGGGEHFGLGMEKASSSIASLPFGSIDIGLNDGEVQQQVPSPDEEQGVMAVGRKAKLAKEQQQQQEDVTSRILSDTLVYDDDEEEDSGSSAENADGNEEGSSAPTQCNMHHEKKGSEVLEKLCGEEVSDEDTEQQSTWSDSNNNSVGLEKEQNSPSCCHQDEETPECSAQSQVAVHDVTDEHDAESKVSR